MIAPMWPLTVGQSTVSARSRCMQLACSSITQTAEHSRITGVRCAECKYTKQSNKPIEAQPSKAVASAWSRPSTVAPSVGLACLHYFLATSNAYAAKICLDVPGWLADPKDALFHSPVLAVGAAVLALVLFPKLIKFSINYLALPAIIALLAWLAISYPQQTANTVYTVLEFIKEHPAASSIGIITAAGVLLGPDLLAGAAVAGVAVLLAVQAGVIQLPAVQMPRLPGQQLVGQQFDKAGKLIKQKIYDLDDEGLATLSSSSSSRLKQQRTANRQTSDPEPYSSPVYDASNSNSSSSNGAIGGRMQLAPPLLPTLADPQSQAALAEQQQQQPPAAAGQQTEPAGQLPASTTFSNLQAMGSKLSNNLGQVSKSVMEKVQPNIPKDLPQLSANSGSHISSSLQAGVQQVQQASQGLQAGLKGGLQSRMGQGLGAAVQGLGSKAQALGSQVQGLGSRVQGLGKKAQDRQAAQGLGNRVGVAATGVVGRVQESIGVLQGKLQQQPQQANGESTSGVDARPASQSESSRVLDDRAVDTVLANS